MVWFQRFVSLLRSGRRISGTQNLAMPRLSFDAARSLGSVFISMALYKFSLAARLEDAQIPGAALFGATAAARTVWMESACSHPISPLLCRANRGL